MNAKPKTALLYDLEIIKAIPPKHGQRNPELEYCNGWGDHANMGISVIGYAMGEIISPTHIAWDEPSYLIGDAYGLRSFEGLINPSVLNHQPLLTGFNSLNFDDKLMRANGGDVLTDYDLLVEARIAAYGSDDYRDAPVGHSYKLSVLAEANGLAKTGTGANAAEQWQRGQHQAVIEYCCHDVEITCKLLNLGLKGRLINPNDGELLTLRAIYW